MEAETLYQIQVVLVERRNTVGATDYDFEEAWRSDPVLETPARDDALDFARRAEAILRKGDW